MNPFFDSADDLRALIATLQQALAAGFSLSQGSSIQPLLECVIDQLLSLAEMVRVGVRKFDAINEGLRFSEDFQDSLGNPLQIRIKFDNPVVLSESLGEFFDVIIELLVEVLQRSEPPQDFMTWVCSRKGLPHRPEVSERQTQANARESSSTESPQTRVPSVGQEIPTIEATGMARQSAIKKRNRTGFRRRKSRGQRQKRSESH